MAGRLCAALMNARHNFFFPTEAAPNAGRSKSCFLSFKERQLGFGRKSAAIVAGGRLMLCD